LIDAYGIDPDSPSLTFKPKSEEGMPAVHSHLEGRFRRLRDVAVVETEDRPRVSRITPYIRQSLKRWRIFEIDGA